MTDQDRRSRSRSPDRSSPADAPAADSSAVEDPVKLYLGNLDYATDEQRLREAFASFGTVTDVFLPTDRETGRVRGFGFVTLSTRAAAMKAIDQMDGTEVDGRTIRVNESRPRGDRGGGGGGPAGGFNAGGAADVKLFCGNLSFDTDTDKLRSLFEKYGEVQDCYMPTDRESGRPRGFAFVTMPAKDAEVAMGKMDGEEIDGRSIRVNEAMAKKESGGFGGRGGDRGGYGGGGDRGGYGGGDRGGHGGGDRGGYERGGYGGGDRGGYGDRGGDRYGGGGDRGGYGGGDRGGYGGGGDRDYDDSRRGGRW